VATPLPAFGAARWNPGVHLGGVKSWRSPWRSENPGARSGAVKIPALAAARSTRRLFQRRNTRFHRHRELPGSEVTALARPHRALNVEILPDRKLRGAVGPRAPAASFVPRVAKTAMGDASSPRVPQLLPKRPKTEGEGAEARPKEEAPEEAAAALVPPSLRGTWAPFWLFSPPKWRFAATL